LCEECVTTSNEGAPSSSWISAAENMVPDMCRILFMPVLLSAGTLASL